MSINEFCGIAVAVSLVVAVAMFVALIGKLNQHPKRNFSK
jgi:hypothetical protein